MKLPLVFKSNETSSFSSSSSIWPWSNCNNNPRTLSFRANNNSSDMFKTSLNTAYINTPDSSYSSFSLKTIIEENGNDEAGCGEDDDSVDMVIKALSSARFFFEVSGETSSILEEASNKKVVNDDGVALFKESVAMEVESRDPFVDFRTSMEEMMEANHGSLFKDNWDFLEELLACYLKVNHKSNHGYIVGAFVDLLVGLEFSSSRNTDYLSPSTSSDDHCCCSSSSIGGGGGGGGHSFTSPLSFYSSASSTSPCLSSLMESEDEIDKSVGDASTSSPLNLSNV
ncbi:hypothetical protein Leryth_006741 [Lithospermum erythrorhizon]|uniref:Transcription repressor n=1 Tax=Lithospermum erythrorhizon TaxID=34254 RepID=A0AAV3RYY1_LITER|nr:hypothetical protein Leryth_006741 [Lithospermum erythrorhizon]